jgi:hypothetical protein
MTGLGWNNLATTYSHLGRNEEALALREKVLEFNRRVLPEDHPHIGEGGVWVTVALHRLPPALPILLPRRRRLSQSRHVILQPGPTRGSARAAASSAHVQPARVAAGPPRYRSLLHPPLPLLAYH